MGIKFKNGEIVTPPVSGETELSVSANGTLQKTDSDGVTASIGVNATNATTANGPTSATTFATALGSGIGYKSTLIAAANNITVSGLNGDVDGNYKIYGKIIVAVDNATVEFQPQSQSSNLKAVNGDMLAGALATAHWKLGKFGVDPMVFPATSTINFWGFLSAKTGRVRYVNINAYVDFPATQDDQFYINGIWTDTSTNMTSFKIASAVAVSFGIGSYLVMVPDYSVL